LVRILLPLFFSIIAYIIGINCGTSSSLPSSHLNSSTEISSGIIATAKIEQNGVEEIKLVYDDISSSNVQLFLTDLIGRVNSLEQGNKIVVEEIKVIKEENKTIKEENKNIKEEIKIVKEENKNIKEENKNIKEENKNIKEEIKIVKEENITLTYDCDVLHRMTDDLSGKVSDLKIDNNFLKQKAFSQGQDIIHLQEFIARIHARELSKIVRYDFFSSCGKLSLVTCEEGCTIDWPVCWQHVNESDLDKWRRNSPITMKDFQCIIMFGK
jgi:chromosome segregation ATPase